MKKYIVEIIISIALLFAFILFEMFVPCYSGVLQLVTGLIVFVIYILATPPTHQL